MLKQAIACVQSHQGPHCSRACVKWAYIRHIPSVNAQTSLSVCAVFQEPLLLSHMYKMGVYMAILSVNAQTRLSKFAVLPLSAFTALAHTQNGCVYGFFYQSMLKQALACVQPHQNLHCSHTCAKWAYIRHILSVNAQTSLSVCAVLSEPSLLSHMHKMGVHMAIFFSQCSDET